MKKYYIINLLLFFISINSFSQTTITFKPGPSDGEDARIFTTHGCILSGQSIAGDDTNYGNSEILYYTAWTYNNRGCHDDGIDRSLLRFIGLNSIPSGATIINAHLKLYGVSSSTHIFDGNSHPNGTENSGWLRRVIGTWNESNVTWNNQPSTVSTHEVPITSSSSQWNWDITLDVKNIVQDIVNDGNNQGFMLRLKNEKHYRSTLFASSDYPDETKRPELIVTYIEPCSAQFTYNVSSNNVYDYTFNASGSSLGNYIWLVDGNQVGVGQNFQYSFPGPGNYLVCLFVKGRNGDCRRCISICISENEIINKEFPKTEKSSVEKEYSNKSFLSDEADKNILNVSSVFPNPTLKKWKLTIQSHSMGEATFSLYDLSGNTINKQKRKINRGQNSYTFNAENLKTGVYLLKIKKEGLTLTQKLIKK